jgi:Xaa-Pro aminopeptidase
VAEARNAVARRRLLALLESRGLKAVILRDPANLAWYSGGARSLIVEGPSVPVFDLVVQPSGDLLVTDEIEAERLLEEELPGLGFEVEILPWTERRVRVLPNGPLVGSDTAMAGRVDLAGEIEAARCSLTGEEVERYRALGRETSAALTETIEALQPEDREWDAAAMLAERILRNRAQPVVLLVAGAARLPRFRHPPPTSAKIGRRAMLVICARRDGLIANVTRLVSFGPLDAEARGAYQRLLRVEAAFLDATRPGQRIGDVFGAGTEAYAANGFGPDEWRRHHQGGPTGYLTRDYLATAASDAIVQAFQAFAWNPSVPGLKVEDTILAGDGHRDGGDVDVLTRDPAWPTVEVAGRIRPAIVER